MTITNHTTRIAEISAWVNSDVDDRKYHAAHCKLDDIETLVRKAHRHIDNLQLNTDSSFHGLNATERFSRGVKIQDSETTKK